MKLSDLQIGERAVIVKIQSHGGFRKRIGEKGLIKGQLIETLSEESAKDLIKYKVNDHEISLRKAEAEKIIVISEAEAHILEHDENLFSKHEILEAHKHDEKPLTDWQIKSVAMKKRHIINVALVGNINCGKTSLFNFATGANEPTGVKSRETVRVNDGVAEFEGYTFNIVDLPNAYSLSPDSKEELCVRKHIFETVPDIIVNVIDTSHLERNFYLTTQLIDMHVRMVCAMNIFAESSKHLDNIEYDKLGQLMGIPMVPTVLNTGKGVDQLFRTIINIYESNEGELENFRHIHIYYGHEIERGINHIQKYLKTAKEVRDSFSTRFLAIKLLEGDKDVENFITTLPNAEEILKVRDLTMARVRLEIKEDIKTAIKDAKYGFIHGALHEAGYLADNKKDQYQTTNRLDRILTNRWYGIPIFFFVLFLMFQTTFTFGQMPMDLIESGVEWLASIVSKAMPDGWMRDMTVNGIIDGVGAVIVFLPQILILYTFISIMEDSGYMARAAFIMDKVMHKMGLHGKSFIPMIMGFGCNVPAILACHTIESKRSRLITMLILPLMSCSARLPIYIMITGVFFAPEYRSTILISLYVIGIVLSIIMSRIFCRYVVKGDDTPFVMELPPYRFPTLRAIGNHTWEKCKDYVKKMGGVILVASITVWALGYFPHNAELTPQQQQEESYIGQLGKVVEPIFRPQGFNWKMDMCLISGVGAKEIVASTMGVLYSADDTDNFDDETIENSSKSERMRALMERDGITDLTAFCFLLFALIYFPCAASISAIRSETKSTRWALFAAGYTTIMAWVISAAVYQAGLFFGFQ